jgi:DNA polymerase-3 subunit alpha (Gram-positive type)
MASFFDLQRFVVFDLEMNGSDKIIEIGAVRYRRGEKLQRFSVLVRNLPVGLQMKSYKYIAKRMGGGDQWISLDMIKDAMPEKKALQRFMAFVGDDPVIGHAVIDGDVRIIKEALQVHELPKWRTLGKLYDTQQIYAALHGNPNQISLANLAHAMGVTLAEQKHRALPDARDTLSVVLAMQRKMSANLQDDGMR